MRIVTIEDEVTAYVRTQAAELAEFAKSVGLVLTIERRPLLPLAMGHAETVVDVRPARPVAAKTDAGQ